MGNPKAIHEAVKAELRVNPLVHDTGITVRNIGGDVTLTGVVTSYPEYLEAAAVARRVAGVKTVHNHLEVVLLPHDYRDDAMLTTEANNTLRANATVPDSVEAIAHDGNLTLTGTVRYGSQGAAAELAVSRLTGVRNIKNDTEIWVDDADPVTTATLVQNALDHNAAADDGSEVSADTYGNTVTLTGHVRTQDEHDAVVAAAWMATGVMEVVDLLQIRE
jgi:osmotically-inducible protein OsmY